MKEFEIRNGVLANYHGAGGDVVIPAGVTSIGKNAFYGYRSLTSVTIPESVTSIGENAFHGCSSLTSVTIPAGVTSIGAGTFSHCTNLTSVTIPEGVTFIGDHTFCGCTSLTSVTILEGVTSIGDWAFDDCTSLTSVTIPAGVTSIGDWAFQYCTCLTSVTIPEGVTSIGDKVFQRCESLTYMTIPQSMLTAGTFDDFLQSVLFALSGEDLALLFNVKQNKKWLAIFLASIKEDRAEALGEALLRRLPEKPSVRECNAIGTFMVEFGHLASAELLGRMHQRLQGVKNGAKALALIQTSDTVREKLAGGMPGGKAIPEITVKTNTLLRINNLSPRTCGEELKRCFGITPKELPPLRTARGQTADAAVLCALLLAHESATYGWRGEKRYKDDYSEPGVRPEAAELTGLLDQDSFQKVLVTIIEQYCRGVRSLKDNLVYPVCRYADEETISWLVKESRWLSYGAAEEFRSAICRSETRAALECAIRRHLMDTYAYMRGMTADEYLNRFVYEIGLDEHGCKVYDLGSQTVTARMQKDFHFIIELPDGKTAKSIPKKNADPEKYEAARADLSRVKKQARQMAKSRCTELYSSFLYGNSDEAENWKKTYLQNPVYRNAAGLLVWSQGGTAFTLTDSGLADSQGQSYKLTQEPVFVAHPMEMKPEEVTAWQRYFAHNDIRQPFMQVWEPVVDLNAVQPDRYAGVMIPYGAFLHKHGIDVEDFNYHDEIEIRFAGCAADVERIDYRRHDISTSDCFKITSFVVMSQDRLVNHLVAYLDSLIIWDLIEKDDAGVAAMLPGSTLAQISAYLDAAISHHAANVTAILLEYKQSHFPDLDPMDEFTLDDLI